MFSFAHLWNQGNPGEGRVSAARMRAARTIATLDRSAGNAGDM